jgi:hypothetical protein
MEYVGTEGRRETAQRITLSLGLVANFYIFTGETVGYYVSPGVGWRLRLDPEQPEEEQLTEIDVYFGATFGPGFRLYEGDRAAFLTGMGPDVFCTVHLNGEHETNVALGWGLGGDLEAHLKIYENIAFAGGLQFCRPALSKRSPVASAIRRTTL